jgi:thiamine kinase-like enzyme
MINTNMLVTISEVHDRPWSKVSKVKYKEKVYYYKQLNKNSSYEIKLLLDLDKINTPNIPSIRVIDHNSFLTSPLIKKDLTNQEILTTYFTIQKHVSSRDTNFRAFNPKKFYEFYSNKKNFVIPNSISRDSLTKIKNILDASSAIPNLLEHNDLHCDNVLLNSNNEIIIIDWADALVAPIGFSLATLYGSYANFIHHLDTNQYELATYLDNISFLMKAPTAEIHKMVRTGAILGEIFRVFSFNEFYQEPALEFIQSKIRSFEENFEQNLSLMRKRSYFE